MKMRGKTLIVLASLWFAFPLNAAFWRQVAVNIEITNWQMAAVAFTAPILMFALEYLFLSVVLIGGMARPLLAVLLVASSYAGFMSFAYGARIDADMIRNVFETTPREAADLVTPGLVVALVLGGVLPAVLACAARIGFLPFAAEARRRLKGCLLAVMCIVLVAAVSFKGYSAFGRNNQGLEKLITPFNYIYGAARYAKALSMARRQFRRLDPDAVWPGVGSPGRAKGPERAADPDSYPVFVFIVGETTRAANFGLNGYARDTTPLLGKADVAYFADTQSCGTATATSVPCMFSDRPRKGFDVDSARYGENLLDLLKQVGFKVVWLENDDGCKGVCDRASKAENMVELGGRHCFGSYCHDEALLDRLDHYLNEERTSPLILVMHAMGSHGPTYYRRYPSGFDRFKPACDTSDIQNCAKDAIVNTYDNTILYADYIISGTISRIASLSAPAAVLYASDHGESLGENGIYLHGLPYAIAPDFQTRVPMLLWLSQGMKAGLDWNCVKARSSLSHDNIFHSVLGLLGVGTKVYDSSLDLAAPCRKG
ncbi:MAG: phosphoethanolamine--lipid A transferase [Rickettsiales bacterium]|jgi:lipid A ethanolaminephosphotransferase|nr:phosphoethanolamine--lipid A transferase [Rickettsiales bacterium]